MIVIDACQKPRPHLTGSRGGRYTAPILPGPTPPLVSDSRITVVIPTKDEEGLIGEIIDAVPPHADEVLVVDGHSPYRTR